MSMKTSVLEKNPRRIMFKRNLVTLSDNRQNKTRGADIIPKLNVFSLTWIEPDKLGSNS